MLASLFNRSIFSEISDVAPLTRMAKKDAAQPDP
jgi:hypothetical protein